MSHPDTAHDGPAPPTADELPSYARTEADRRPSLLDDFELSLSSSVPAAAAAAASPSSPPSYARHDPTARAYVLRPPVIYSCPAVPPPSSSSSSSSSSLASPPPPQQPAYHLASLRPHAIALAPLTPSDARLISRRGSPCALDALGRRARAVPFDEDTALYRSARSSGLAVGVPGLEIEPLKAPPRALAGRIRLEAGTFWRETRRRTARVEKERAEDERRMSRHGWKPAKEWDRRRLFVVERRGWMVRGGGGYGWRDGAGKVVALESVGPDHDGSFRLDLVAEPDFGCETGEGGDGAVDQFRTEDKRAQVGREALITCWVGRIWASGCISLDTYK